MTSSDGPKGRSGAQGGRGGVRGARCVALIGPFASGKTTLLEAILARTGGISRAGSISAKSTVGDNTPEAREHAMSVGVNVADVSFLEDKFTFIDCPGSVEFAHEGALALSPSSKTSSPSSIVQDRLNSPTKAPSRSRPAIWRSW